MRVLVGGETSGKVRDAFLALGHDAISCDLLPTDVPGPHYQGNYWDIIHDDWDLGIFHPTCQYMCNSGVKHLYIEEGRWEKMVEHAEDFKRLTELTYPYCIENPIMHGHAKQIIGRHQDQIVQPWQFGHEATKATCFWLQGLWPLRATWDLGPPPVEAREKWAKVHREPPGPLRWKIRSETYDGIAKAMAWQWGGWATGLHAAMIRAEFQTERLLQELRK